MVNDIKQRRKNKKQPVLSPDKTMNSASDSKNSASDKKAPEPEEISDDSETLFPPSANLSTSSQSFGSPFGLNRKKALSSQICNSSSQLSTNSPRKSKLALQKSHKKSDPDLPQLEVNNIYKPSTSGGRLDDNMASFGGSENPTSDDCVKQELIDLNHSSPDLFGGFNDDEEDTLLFNEISIKEEEYFASQAKSTAPCSKNNSAQSKANDNNLDIKKELPNEDVCLAPTQLFDDSALTASCKGKSNLSDETQVFCDDANLDETQIFSDEVNLEATQEFPVVEKVESVIEETDTDTSDIEAAFGDSAAILSLTEKKKKCSAVPCPDALDKDDGTETDVFHSDDDDDDDDENNCSFSLLDDRESQMSEYISLIIVYCWTFASVLFFYLFY